MCSTAGTAPEGCFMEEERKALEWRREPTAVPVWPWVCAEEGAVNVEPQKPLPWHGTDSAR